MQQKNTGVWIGVLIAIVIAFGALFTALSGSGSAVPAKQDGPKLGSSVNGGNVTDYSAVNVVTGYWQNSVQILGTLSTGFTELILGSSSGVITQTATVGSCNSASSTLFAVLNPFSATSTATLVSLQAVGNATTSQLAVGTSTTSTGLGSVSQSLVASTTVATSSAFFIASGIASGSGASYLTPATPLMRSIVVGPSQYVAGYAGASSQGTQYTSGFTSCTYSIRWER